MSATEPNVEEVTEAAWSRRIQYAIIGVVQGLALWLLVEIFGDQPSLHERAALAFPIILTPPMLYFGLGRGSDARAVAAAVAIPVGLGALFYWSVWRFGPQFDSSEAVYIDSCLLGVLFAFIAMPFIQSWLSGERPRFAYPTLLRCAWGNGLTVAVAWAAVGLLWLVLALWAALFALIGVNAFGELFSEAWFISSVTGATLGVATALAIEHEGVVLAIRRLGFAILSALAPILAVAGVMFVGALVITGLEPLWRTEFATVIVATTLAVGIALSSIIARDGVDPSPRLAIWPVWAFLVAMPAFAAIAGYAMWLRVDQYGLTPERVIAGLIVGVLALYAIAYGLGALVLWSDWPRAVRAANRPIAWLILALIILVQTPLLDPWKLSADHQLARLKSGEVEAAKFDFDLLKHDLGAYGAAAIEAIRADQSLADRATIENRLTALDEHGRAPIAAEPKPTLKLEDLMIRPEGVEPPAGFIDHLNENASSVVDRCSGGHYQCAAVFVDLVGGPELEAVFAVRDPQRHVGHVGFTVWLRSEEGWRKHDSWNLHNEESATHAWAALVRGKIETVDPDYRLLKLGDQRIKLNPTQ